MNELITISWAITTKCNYNCYYCYARYDYNNQSFDMKDTLVSTILSKLKALSKTNPLRLVLLGGEPTLNKDIFHICKELLGFCKYIIVVTNGSNVEKLKELPSEITLMVSYHGQDVQTFCSTIEELRKTHLIEISCVLDPTCMNNIKRLGLWCKERNISCEMIPMLHNETQQSEEYSDELLNDLYTNVYYDNPHMEMFRDGKLSCLDIYKKCKYNKGLRKMIVCIQPSFAISVDGYINPGCPTGQLKYRTHINDDKAFKYNLVCDSQRCLINRGAMDLSGWRHGLE